MKFKFTKKVDPSFDYFDWNGIKVPFSTNQKLVLDGKETVPDKPHISYLKRGNIQAACISMAREALILLMGEMTFQVRGWDAPTAVSASVPEGAIYLDKRGVPVVNEDWGDQHALDADGDRCSIHRHKDNPGQAVLVKYPVTSTPITGLISKDGILEKFTGLTVEDSQKLISQYNTSGEVYGIPGDGITVEFGKNTPYQEEKFFLKGHTPAPVGLLTNGWNTYELDKAQAKRGWARKIDSMFNNYQRYEDIELGGLKAARKDEASLADSDITKLDYALAYQHAWALTGTGRLAGLSEQALEWFPALDEKGLKQVLTDISKLNVDFRKREENDFERRKPTLRTSPFLKKLLPARYYYKGKLIENPDAITKGGLIKFYELKAMPGAPSAVVIWLQRPEGIPVALTDVKRKDHDPEGLGFAYVLYPVWDNRELYSNDKTGDQSLMVSAKSCWVHPIDHLEKCLRQFDNKVINPENGVVVSRFPESWEEWNWPSRAGKIKRLQKFLTDYCGEYGDVVNCTMRNRRPELLEHNIKFARASAVIDYGGIELTPEQMWKIASKASSKLRLCLGGNKQTKSHVRKYCIADESGTPAWGAFKTKCHPARQGKQRAQLVHALKEVRMRVAIVNCNTLTQCFITPSGIEKQTTSSGFLPMCLNSLGDAQAYLDSLTDLEKANMPDNFLKGTEFTTWTGQKVTVWVVNPRNTVQVGKLISTRAEKFVPRVIGPVVDLDDFNANMENKQIDLVIPVTELINKGAHTNMLEKCTEHMIHFKSYVSEDLTQLGDITIPAMVGEFIYFRSGAHSENTPPRWRTCRYKGIDGHVIIRQIEKLYGKEWEQEVNILPALELLDSMKKIMKRCGIKFNR